MNNVSWRKVQYLTRHIATLYLILSLPLNIDIVDKDIDIDTDTEVEIEVLTYLERGNIYVCMYV